jgi:two-component system, NtrC family, sensor histidine kinase HydH
MMNDAVMSKAIVSPQYAELAELAGSFIHEIKNHLSTLGLNLQLLAEDFQEPQSHRERRALERIQRLQCECGRLVDVSNDFLQFARLQELELAPGHLAEVVEELIDFFGPTAQQANIEIKCYLPADLPPIELNRELLCQAFLNLMLNAQQAMPEGGELTIQAALEPGPGIPGPIGVSVAFIDTGKGISQEVLIRIFRPFFSTKPGGSGLGLPTARKIIEAHGGTIEVESDVGHGTRFKVWLPAMGE